MVKMDVPQLPKDDNDSDNDWTDIDSSESGDSVDSDTGLIPADLNVEERRQYLREMIKALPQPVQNRIGVLKKMALEKQKIELEFLEEVKQLEHKYHLKYLPLYEKRKAVVNGTVEPAATKKNWPESKDPGQELNCKTGFKESLGFIKRMPNDVKGIPGFWLTVFQNAPILTDMIQSIDEQALFSLTDVCTKYDDDGFSYTLEFHFAKNKYFSNPVLTKRFGLVSNANPNIPFHHAGLEIVSSSGCDISWKDMDLTVNAVKKTQKHKERGTKRTVFENMPADSFFNFFSTPEFPDGGYEAREIVSAHYEVSFFLRTRVIPRAVLYCTGEAGCHDFEETDSDDDDDDDDDDFHSSVEEEEEGEGGLHLTKKHNKHAPSWIFAFLKYFNIQVN